MPTPFRRYGTRKMHRMSRKRSSGGHITVSINSGSHIGSEVGSILSCPTSANADSMSVIKTRQRETALEDATDDALRIEPAHTAPTEGWQVDLEQALSELPDDNRVAVSMFYMGDHSLKEISEFLGVSVNTVKGKLYRARQQLGNALSERYGSLLKSHKLKGGFLMQFMEQIHHIPSPTMASSWSSHSYW